MVGGHLRGREVSEEEREEGGGNDQGEEVRVGLNAGRNVVGPLIVLVLRGGGPGICARLGGGAARAGRNHR